MTPLMTHILMKCYTRVLHSRSHWRGRVVSSSWTIFSQPLICWGGRGGAINPHTGLWILQKIEFSREFTNILAHKRITFQSGGNIGSNFMDSPTLFYSPRAHENDFREQIPSLLNQDSPNTIAKTYSTINDTFRDCWNIWCERQTL